ncbi:uncharacterized protein LOC101783645 [Setaria italica]|uniref:uncharacterized protein LOC101783645 n=1 Tax=Setaria italica TaxID=4555 RepID=UPI000BE4B3F4|nr:uncharacterized protein LOC101783645 [Setaria italica]
MENPSSLLVSCPGGSEIRSDQQTRIACFEALVPTHGCRGDTGVPDSIAAPRRAETKPIWTPIHPGLAKPYTKQTKKEKKSKSPKAAGSGGGYEEPAAGGRMADHLPDDLLADVLVRLAPRGLATSRGVCRSWRAVVDARRLLRADLLPLSLEGLLLEVDAWALALFSRPSTGPATCDGLVGFLGADGTRQLDTYMRGHCNGLLLLQELVINPATGQWARLPGPPPPPLPGFGSLLTAEAIRMAALAIGPARLLVEDGTVGGEDLGAGRTWSLLPPCRSYRDRGDGPWLLRYLGEDDDDDEGQFEWSSDIEDVAEPEDGAGGCNGDDDDTDEWARNLEYIDFLGFHPFKEVVFLRQSGERGIAYHLDRSKIQDMGTLDLRRTTEFIEMAFPYTPCRMGVFPENN